MINAEDEFLEPENLPELPKTLGIRMLEGDSIDRVVDGLKMAGEGMMHLAHWRQDPTWGVMARGLDALRVNLSRMARSRPSDEAESRDPGGMGNMTAIESYTRIFDGITMAAKACRQIASGHRGDLRWTMAANNLDVWRDRMSVLVRKRKKQTAAPSILLPN